MLRPNGSPSRLQHQCGPFVVFFPRMPQLHLLAIPPADTLSISMTDSSSEHPVLLAGLNLRVQPGMFQYIRQQVLAGCESLHVMGADARTGQARRIKLDRQQIKALLAAESILFAALPATTGAPAASSEQTIGSSATTSISSARATSTSSSPSQATPPASSSDRAIASRTSSSNKPATSPDPSRTSAPQPGPSTAFASSLFPSTGDQP